MKISFIVCLLALLCACGGYQIGGHKPSKLAKIRNIAVPMVQNRTLFPRADATATNSIVDALTKDGTYRISTLDEADAILYVSLNKIKYDQSRSSREDTLRSEELEMRVTLDWQLSLPTQRNKPLEAGSATGHTRLFAQGNLQTARAGALPDALMRASQMIVSRLADGY